MTHISKVYLVLALLLVRSAEPQSGDNCIRPEEALGAAGATTFDPISLVKSKGLDPSKIKILYLGNRTYDYKDQPPLIKIEHYEFSLRYDGKKVGGYTLETSKYADKTITQIGSLDAFVEDPKLKGKGLGTFAYLAMSQWAYKNVPDIGKIQMTQSAAPEAKALWDRLLVEGIAEKKDGKTQLNQSKVKSIQSLDGYVLQKKN